MTEVLAVFRSRSQAIDCNARLRAAGIPAGLINTPKEANIGCGLSIKLPQGAYERAKRIISNVGYSAFYGYLKMQKEYGRTFIGRIG
ncbi:MAG: DUF3343 domain-containing protein [Clostridia bacterium]|nr:DUF3343 domain-containing protein [Clostridia bacterium]